MAQNEVSWFYESASERQRSNYSEVKSAFGAYQKNNTKSFNEKFEELCNHYKENGKVDIKKDITAMLSDISFMEQYKNDLLGDIFTEFKELSPNDPHVDSIIENVNRFWDNKVKSYNESASITGFLPIATLEFPVLAKQFFSSILNDITDVEVTKSPNIAKHIRETYIVDNLTGDELEYPKCLFDGTWQQMWAAAKGFPIKEEVVEFDNGRLNKFDIIANLTDGTPGVDKLSFAFKIKGIQVGDEVIYLRGNGITIEYSTGGTLVNGDLNFVHKGTQINDVLAGKVDFQNGTISMASTSGQVTGVVFEGYLSNERNTRNVSVREKRKILRYTIEDGGRYVMPFTIEEIEDAAALLDINYYNRMVDEIVKVQDMNECVTTIKYINDLVAKYNDVVTNIWNLEPTVRTYKANIQPRPNYAGDPFKYISSAIQFKLRAVIQELTNLTKLDGLSFVISGNPMATNLIEEFLNWKLVQGSSIGGINVNRSYGFINNMGGNVRVVASNIYDAYTVDPVQWTDWDGETHTSRELVLHVTAFPTDSEHISTKHLKYTSHLFTSQSQTAYQAVNAPGGAYNIVTVTSRFKDIDVQYIGADIILCGSELVYGPAPQRPPIEGAPWGTVPQASSITP